jgi:hypothetical protein
MTRQKSPAHRIQTVLRWVMLQKYCKLTGESAEAVRKRRLRGEWLDGQHTRMRNRRLWVNIEAAQRWLEGTGGRHR